MSLCNSSLAPPRTVSSLEKRRGNVEDVEDTAAANNKRRKTIKQEGTVRMNQTSSGQCRENVKEEVERSSEVIGKDEDTLYIFYDLETTNFNRKGERIIEIALVILDGAEDLAHRQDEEGSAITEKILGKAFPRLRSFRSLVNPEKKIEPLVVEKTRITDKMVVHAPSFVEVMKDVALFCKQNVGEKTRRLVFVGHNSWTFDDPFLKRVFVEMNDRLGKSLETFVDSGSGETKIDFVSYLQRVVGRKILVESGDTYRAASRARKADRSETPEELKLEHVFRHLSTQDLQGAHSALVDAAATAYIFTHPAIRRHVVLKSWGSTTSRRPTLDPERETIVRPVPLH